MSQGSEIRHVFVSDTAAAHESLIIDGLGNDGSEKISIDRGGFDARVASADASPDELITDHIEGNAPKRDDAELRAAQYLVNRLNQLGDDWNSPHLARADARTERGVDCIARGNSIRKQLLQIQVTTTEREVWRQREYVHERNAEKLAIVEAIRAAIQDKATRADRRITLALDATDSPRAAFRSVVDAFRTKYGMWAAGVGFQEIWLVGPVAALVNRLDTEGQPPLVIHSRDHSA